MKLELSLRKKNRNVESSEVIKNPNSVSISDAETESGNEKSDASDKEEIEENPEKPEKHTKNTKYTKEEFIARNMVVKKNLGCKNQCLSLIRNTNQKRKSTITSFVNG